MNLRYDMINCFAVRRTGKGDEFLQLRRIPGIFMGGVWEIIHGHIEPGETAWQATLRELREETALIPLEFYQLDTIDLFYLAADDGLWHSPGFCAIVEPAAGVQFDDEHDDYRWLERGIMPQSILWPGERQQFEELCREILEDGQAKPYLRIGK